MNRIRIVFMGSAKISKIMLERLCAEQERFQVVGCVTQPDKPAKRGKKLVACPCREFVEARGIPCLTPARVNTPESLAQIAAWLPDVIVVVAYGQFLGRRLLDIPTLGCVNIHLSLLPRHRGASPIHAALLDGDPVAGVSAMLMDEGMDTGPVLMTESLPVLPEETYTSLEGRLARLGADVLVKVLPEWAFFRVRPTPQDPDRATTAYKIKKSDGLVRWEEPTGRILRKLRAYEAWPTSFTLMPDDHRECGKRLKVLAAKADTPSAAEGGAAPGTILSANGDGIRVKTGDGVLRLLAIQPEGGSRMDVASWLRGHTLDAGMRFATPPVPDAPPPEAFRRS